MSERLHVLVVEDNLADVDLIREYMADSRLIHFQIDSVSCRSEAIARLERERFDILFIDLGLPDSRGLKTFHDLQKAAPDTPTLILTGYDDEETAIAAVRSGAQDYIIKGEIIGNLLVRAAQYAVERKRAEEVLKVSEAKFREFFENSQVGMYRSKFDGSRFLDVNVNFVDMLGYSREELLETPERILWANQDDRDRMIRILNERSGILTDYEARIIAKNGEVKNVIASIILNPDEGTLDGTMVDITGRKRAEKALEVSLEKYRVLFESFPLGITISDKSGKIIEANRQSELLLGVPCGVHTQRRIDGNEWRIIQKDGSPMRADEYASIRALRENRLIENVEMGIVKDKGEITWISVTAAPMPLEGYGVAIAYGDVTERMRVEEALRQSEENFRRSLDESPLGIRIVSAEGETLYGNRAILGIFGYDDIEELRSTPVAKRYTPASYAEYQVRKKKRMNGEDYPSEYEISIITKTGEIRHLQVFRKEILWDGQKQFQAIYRDITERKQAEEVIQASLREKETLLREIHHRVKNNMQVISSLFNLQAEHITDEKARRMLKDGQLRIRSMALIHEKLYQSRNLSKIDFADYLRTLSEHLFQFFKDEADRSRLETDLEHIHLDINSAVPCGLIINELVSNALRHAFPEGRKGVIRIGMRREGDGTVELRIADDGVGIPEGVDFRDTESLGLQIVNLLVGQLEGTIELDRKEGTAFTITFHELKYKRRL
jgi:PAS domain S-box-containing protein